VSDTTLQQLLREVRACRVCQEAMGHEARPVIRAGSPKARIVLIGQAPGTKVHTSGVPWDDVSGDNLRRWLGVEKEVFYDETRFALVPMGFCFPGQKTVKGRKQDLPPRPECAPLWHERVLAELPRVELIVLTGAYAIGKYLQTQKKQTLTQTVQRWKEYGPRYFPIPHPSPRNRLWLRKNPWFEEEVVPTLRSRVKKMMGR
jgi:uracil-DNA glycosylase